jgi:thermitase
MGGGDLRVYVPLQFEGFSEDASVWIVLTELKVETETGTVRVEPRGANVAVNSRGLPAPPVVWMVDPPMVKSSIESQGIYLVGERLDHVVNVMLERPNGFEELAPSSVISQRSDLSRVDLTASTEAEGGWLWKAVDGYGRRIGRSRSLGVCPLEEEYRNAAGRVLGDVHTVSTDRAIPGEVLVHCTPHAIIFPESRADEIVAVSDVELSPAFENVTTAIGVVGVERVFKRPPDSAFWKRPKSKRDYLRGEALRNVYKLHLDPGADLQSTVMALRSHGNIFCAELNTYGEARATPNDTMYYRQWALNPSPFNPPASSEYHINVEDAWDRSVGNSAIKIAVLDTGVDYRHLDLGGGIGTGYPVAGGWDFVNNDSIPLDDHSGFHGTLMTGLLGAITANDYAIAGVAGGWAASSLSGCQMMALKVGDQTGYYDKALCASAIAEAGWGYGVHVNNMSFGWAGTSEYSELVHAAMVSAYMDGVIGVAAKGYEDQTIPDYPGSYISDRCISVGAYDGDMDRWPANSGYGLSLMGPGDFSVSTDGTTTPDSLKFFQCGTSGAAAHVSGAAGLLMAYDRSPWSPLAPEDVKNVLQVAAALTSDPGAPGPDSLFGHGFLEVNTALDVVEPPDPPSNEWQYDTALRHLARQGGTATLDYSGYLRFSNLAGGPLNGTYYVFRHKVQGPISLYEWFAYMPYAAWGRGEPGGVGYTSSVPVFGDNYCSVVPGSMDEYSVEAFTYVYEVWTLDLEEWLGWYPAPPDQAVLQISVYGPVLVPPAVAAPEVAGPRDGKFRVIPNPSRGQTRFLYDVPGSQGVEFSVFDVRGARVRSGMLGTGSSGEVRWDGADSQGRALPSGVYFVKLEAEERRVFRKIVLIR